MAPRARINGVAVWGLSGGGLTVLADSARPSSPKEAEEESLAAKKNTQAVGVGGGGNLNDERETEEGHGDHPVPGRRRGRRAERECHVIPRPILPVDL